LCNCEFKRGAVNFIGAAISAAIGVDIGADITIFDYNDYYGLRDSNLLG
jgi:hypothetical protein